MGITCRKYKDISDYKKICEFLQETYSAYGTRFYDNITLFEIQCGIASGIEGHLIEIDDILKDAFLWFDDDRMVARLIDGSFCLKEDYRYLFKEMVELREKLCLESKEDIEWEILERDNDFESILANKGYNKTEEYWVRRELDTDNIEKGSELPEGFYVKLVPELKDLEKVYEAYKLCYGILFNDIMFEQFYKTSTYRKELDMVIMSPEDEVVALCSGRYDEKNKMASIEAVSCYKEYRKRGISKAMIYYALNEAKKLGAKKVTVFTAMPEKFPAPNRLYESVGFNVVGKSYVWKKEIK